MRRLLLSPLFFAVAALALPVYAAVQSLRSWREPFAWGDWGLCAWGALLSLPLLRWFSGRVGMSDSVGVPRLWALLGLAVLLNGVNLFAYAAPWQLGLAVFMTLGCMCLAPALLGRWGVGLLWGLFLFLEFGQAIGMLEYGSSINSLVLAETLEASQEEFFSYCTPGNALLALLSALVAAAVSCALHRILRPCSRPALFRMGVLWVALALLAGTCVPPKHRTPQYFWPATEAVALVNALVEALSVNQETITQAESLPSPAWRPSSIRTLQGNESVVLVLHVGESIRADRMSINGYERDTTPWLRRQSRLVNWSNCISAACDTCQAELVILTNGRRAITDRDPATQPTTGSVLDLFAANGFSVYSFFGRRCAQQLKYDRVVRVLTRVSRKRFNAPGSPWTTVPQMQQVLVEHPRENLVFFVNNEGSHVPFEHFDRKNPPFAPAVDSFENPAARAEEVNNAYDSTIHYTDEFFRRVAEALSGRPWVYVYISDHGEYLGHDGLWGRAGLGEDRVPYHRTTGSRVGAFVLWSPEFEALHPHVAEALQGLKRHANLRVGHEHLFHTLLGLFGVETPYYDPTLDLTSGQVQPYIGPGPDLP